MAGAVFVLLDTPFSFPQVTISALVFMVSVEDIDTLSMDPYSWLVDDPKLRGSWWILCEIFSRPSSLEVLRFSPCGDISMEYIPPMTSLWAFSVKRNFSSPSFRGLVHCPKLRGDDGRGLERLEGSDEFGVLEVAPPLDCNEDKLVGRGGYKWPIINVASPEDPTLSNILD